MPRVVKMYGVGTCERILEFARSYDEIAEPSKQILWANLLKEAGIFRSTSEAIKNNFKGEIGPGFHYWEIGHLHHQISVLRWDKEHEDVFQKNEECWKRGQITGLEMIELNKNCLCDWCTGREPKRFFKRLNLAK